MNVDVVNDQGGIVIHTYLKRVKEGIKVTVQVAPEVEEFFRHWGTGREIPSTVVGKAWRAFPVKEDVIEPVRVWEFNPIKDQEASLIDIYGIGKGLTQTPEKPQNISFIRLVGASKPGGVTFVYEDVVSRSGLDVIAQRIQAAGDRFYDQFIRPVNLHVILDKKIARLE